MDKNAYVTVYLPVILFLTVLIFTTRVYGQDCQGCHTNPVYKREDIDKLKECLLCHGSAGHPYKKVVSTSMTEVSKNSNKPSLLNRPGAAAPQIDTAEMILIPEGEFLMGSDDRLRDEKPAHIVYIDAFYIDKFEVTNEEYKAFIDSTGHPPPDNWKDGNYPEGKGKHPVVFVSWYDADAYCKWLGKRLPRETEWEKAARGTEGYIYPWGNKWDPKRSNNPFTGHEDTMPVGSYEEGKSPYGLYDMSGNVWEWVDDYYLPHPGSDYVSPEFGEKYRLLKGGSWMNCLFYNCGISAPTFNRAFFDAYTKNSSLGFRCAKDAD